MINIVRKIPIKLNEIRIVFKDVREGHMFESLLLPFTSCDSNICPSLTALKTKLAVTSRRQQWHPTPVLLPGKSHGQRGLVGCSLWGR